MTENRGFQLSEYRYSKITMTNNEVSELFTLKCIYDFNEYNGKLQMSIGNYLSTCIKSNPDKYLNLIERYERRNIFKVLLEVFVIRYEYLIGHYRNFNISRVIFMKYLSIIEYRDFPELNEDMLHITSNKWNNLIDSIFNGKRFEWIYDIWYFSGFFNAHPSKGLK